MFPHDPRGGRRLSPGEVSAVEARLTGRDRRILALLEEHFTFTTSHLALLAGFSSVITAQHRLATLYQRRVLERARPFRAGGGSYEWHWMLGPAGAKIIAAERRVTPTRPAKIAARWQKLFHGWRYRELAAQHTWFCTLISSAQNENSGAGELARWHSAWRVSKAWGATTDGYGVWRCSDGGELPFVVLLDDPPRAGTHELRERITSIPCPAWTFTHRAGFPRHTATLIWCHTLEREQIIRRAITKHVGTTTPMPVFLACGEYADMVPGGPHGRVWIPVGALRQEVTGRLTLAELAGKASTPTPARAEATGTEGGGNAELIVYDNPDPDDPYY